ncbi:MULTISPECIES: hypothetical protein [unclassified Microbacterium]|uniref:hypothetical protein n=1 Tax=unclassified Microbacterium TaxID=2609290 RepID=UPI000EAA379C|nr:MULTISPECIES: hypothetical protein [unclassified Microbacterium]MBT2484818.1 hypothetical protein [Microbacterium sp. ISL-108]RKN67689.1 hypothetical protein D7252_08880 [Microbacterium sp. CGR2]
MSGKTYFERNNEGIGRAIARNECAEPGPWGTVCTEDIWHRYSHYDSGDDSSWQDDWRDYGPDDEDDPDTRPATPPENREEQSNG